MKIAPEITFRGMSATDALEADIQEKLEKLDRFFPDIMSARVTVEANHKHHHKGNLYHVRVDLTVPGQELVVSRDPKDHQAHEDAYVAIRDAFAAARRQLENYARKLRGNVKTHSPPSHGRVVELVPAMDYGRIETPDGRLVYFHRNSLVDADFDQLEAGAEIRFAEEAGAEGPQASSVHRVGKHHIVG
ncbi:HPF/RaiA family ribosome-associated protein [Thiohalocapsa marina]|uniref:HPF/RaiA family ribosome-associated protein n=1 Tax=Thiohalocapsa marina TaxID=424902 RepID=A0A5M8FI60_9GAMM|nr:HPF/RaiA family ribosome-associated protein [Thiohalocapsa marina]KAA6184603.1 HPF/RaiA family ribosome-associated protein [Thiohalocapsa marina]